MTKRQQALLNELKSLPKGYISRKVIRGRETFYLQWKENGKVKSKYLKHDEVDGFREQIRRRHAIQEILLKEGHSALIPAQIADYDVIPKTDNIRILDAYIDNKDRSLSHKITRFLHITKQ